MSLPSAIKNLGLPVVLSITSKENKYLGKINMESPHTTLERKINVN
jgi:hypothetical protein